jgi:predicted nucleotidyltransferase
LVDHVAFQQALEDHLHRPVDVVTERSLHPRIRSRVLREAVAL